MIEEVDVVALHLPIEFVIRSLYHGVNPILASLKVEQHDKNTICQNAVCLPIPHVVLLVSHQL